MEIKDGKELTRNTKVRKRKVTEKYRHLGGNILRLAFHTLVLMKTALEPVVPNVHLALLSAVYVPKTEIYASYSMSRHRFQQ